MSRRILYINKADGHHESAHVPISHLCWIDEVSGRTGRSERVAMWKFLERGGKAYVRDARGNVAVVERRTNRFGTRFVRTKPDKTRTDNLLKLPECRYGDRRHTHAIPAR